MAWYDSNKNFRYLSKNHIKPAIKTRRNSKVNKLTVMLEICWDQDNKQISKDGSVAWAMDKGGWQKRYSLVSRECLVSM